MNIINSESWAVRFYLKSKKSTIEAQVERSKCLANDEAADLSSRQDLTIDYY